LRQRGVEKVKRERSAPRKQVCGGVALGPNVKAFSRFLGVRALLRGLCPKGAF
jgi:hypothetical protein